jgi:CRISPR-associated protein Csm4
VKFRDYSQGVDINMSDWKLVKLKFGRSPAHFGELGIGIEQTSERVRSDTLFSAWISAYARLTDKHTLEEVLQQFNSQEPPFRLSSAFVYQQMAEKTVYYLPRPLRNPIGYPAGADDLAFAKTYKSLKYLPLEVWQRWYQGEGFKESDRQELIHKTQGEAGGALTRAGTFSYSQAFEFHKIPKIAVDCTTRATNLYHTGFVQYRWQPNSSEPDGVESLSGLYFLVQFPPSSQLEQTFFAVLNFLGGEGIGGERSSGAGQFKVEQFDLSLIKPWKQVTEFAEGNCHSLMSLFWQHPLPPEMLNQASYELQERGGWITSSSSDGRQMFTEGSVFAKQPQGSLANVTPTGFDQKPYGHKIYRSGISLSLSVNVQSQEQE